MTENRGVGSPRGFSCTNSQKAIYLLYAPVGKQNEPHHLPTGEQYDPKKDEVHRLVDDLLALPSERQLQEESLITVDDADDGTTRDVDVKLMRAARDCGGTVITTDAVLQKAAAISSVRTINLHSLADALRPAVAEGMTVTLRIAREGKEPGQGIGHLPDGTMVVVENGKGKVGEETEVTVTAVRQTSGGRMVFAKAE